MKDKEQKLADMQELRSRAEKGIGDRNRQYSADMSQENIYRLIHELETHQIELEMQNEALALYYNDLQEMTDQYAELYDHAPVGYLTMSEKGLIQQSNLVIAEMLKVPRTNLFNQPLTKYIASEDQDLYYLHRNRLLKSQLSQGCDLRLYSTQGDLFWVRLDSMCVKQASGGCSLTRTTLSDITKRKQAEEELKDSTNKFRALVETTQDFIWEVTADGIYSYCSPQTIDMLGYRPEELLGKTPFDLMPPHEAKRVAEIFIDFVGKKAPFKAIENINLTKDGKEVVLETSGVPFFGPNGELQGYRGVDRDITERKTAEAELHHLATHDPLTGLYNRNVLEKRMTDEIHRANRYQQCLSIFMLDIDHFKQVNDDYGHQAGDMVLRSFARVLEESLRETDYAARYGGEEFVIILPETPLSEIKNLAERLCKNIAQCPFPIEDDKVLKITVSIGASVYPEHGDSLESLLNAADSAMYVAKDSGRNCVRIAKSTIAAR